MSDTPNDTVLDEASEAPARHPAAVFITTFVLPIAIVGFGLACAGILIMSAPSAERNTGEPLVSEVLVREIAPTTRNASVQGTGAVRPARSVRLTAQVQGKVVSMADLAPGSRFEKGEVIATLDSRDYRAAVAAQEQAVAQAELNLALERNRSDLAKKEWELLGKKGKASDLTLRVPHLRAAEKALEAAQAALEQARANLGRTQIRAPFNGVVVDENIDVGTLVGPTVPIATLVGTDAFWVDVSLPVEKLDGVKLPESGEASKVRVIQKLGAGKQVIREGYVKQLGGQLDPQSRTATVLVEIPNPYGVEGLPLLPGAFVSAEIDGRSLQDTWEINRSLVEDGRFVWVVDRESNLARRELEVGWRTDDSLIATGGIVDGDRLVTSNMVLPVEGQTVIALPEEG